MFVTAKFPLVQTAPGQIGHSSADGALHLPRLAGVGSGNVLVSDGKGGAKWGPVSGVSVSSFNSRTGAVVPVAGDYAFADLSGSLASTQLPAFSGGDVTSSAGSAVLTLSSVITAAGPVGGAATVPVITYDAKGRLTSVSTATITPASIGALASGATAVAATKLATARTIGITGDATWTSPAFDGTSNVTAALTLASVITAAGPVGSSSVVPVITYDAKGRLTSVTTATITPASIGALASGAQAVDSAKLGGQFPSYYQTQSSNLSFLSSATGTGLVYMGSGGYSVTTLSASYLVLGNGTGYLLSNLATAASVPQASSTTPAALGTAAVGTGTTWARADHVHAMPTAAQVGALGATATAADSSKLGGQIPSYYATAASLSDYIPKTGGVVVSGFLNMYADLYINAGYHLRAADWYTTDGGIYSTSGTFTFATGTNVVMQSASIGSLSGLDVASGTMKLRRIVVTTSTYTLPSVGAEETIQIIFNVASCDVTTAVITGYRADTGAPSTTAAGTLIGDASFGRSGNRVRSVLLVGVNATNACLLN